MKRNLTFVRLITVNALLIFITDWLSPKISSPILSHLRKMHLHLSKTDMKRETMTDFSLMGVKLNYLNHRKNEYKRPAPIPEEKNRIKSDANT
jgi:hypothetical protein